MRLLKGQSLVELLIAMFVIVVGLTAATNMILSNARTQEESAARVVGANLAREGVELAKAVRDSNWIAGGSTSFVAGLASGTDYTGVPRMEGGVFIDFDFSPDTIGHANAIIKQSTNAGSRGLFVQGNGSSGQNTIYRRLVTLAPICNDGSILSSGSSCTGGNPQVGVRVSSLAQWTNRTGTHTSLVEDEFYDWR